MKKTNFSCLYIERCSTRKELPSEHCHDENSVNGCFIYRIYKIREDVAERKLERRRNVLALLTGNI